jgi:hypothetical protein
MSILTKPSGAFSASLIYITIGTLIDIWMIVSLVFYPPSTDWGHFLVVGFLVSGFAILIIGLFLGPIGRAARHAELPPTEVTAAVANTEQTAAANPPAIAAVNPMPQATPPLATPVATVAATTTRRA